MKKNQEEFVKGFLLSQLFYVTGGPDCLSTAFLTQETKEQIHIARN